MIKYSWFSRGTSRWSTCPTGRGFWPGKVKALGDLIAAFHYLWVGYQEDRARIFTAVQKEDVGQKTSNVKWERIQPGRRKSFFTMRTVKQWNGLLRRIVQSGILGGFQMGMAFKNWIKPWATWSYRWPSFKQEVGLEASWDPFNLK